MKRLLPVISAIGILVATAGVWLFAQGGPEPAFGPLTATPVGFIRTSATAVPNIVKNSPTVVTFAVPINTPTLNPTTVQLQRVDSAGKLFSTVGQMSDNGKDGDVQSGDKIFTLRATLNESASGKLYFRVAAGFRGNAQNRQSASIPIDVDPIPLPPDPGADGKQTLSGIDTDHDGVRDDVQRYIGVTLQFPPGSEADSAAKQYSVAMQSMIAAVDQDQSNLAAQAVIAGGRCMAARVGIEAAYKNSQSLTKQLLNTDNRAKAYYANQRRFSALLDSPQLNELSAFCAR